ncbi:MAG: helix-turn-helix transcriptional regulator [Thermoanaerobacteraceae bacterium]|nr:helix-turn-helix transcriptional regulator [Thermoanaerobacteraceae bacterium]
MLGKRIREARERKGLKQVDLAKLTGLANSTICDIEKDRIKPSIDSLAKIAEAMELPISYFIPSRYENNVRRFPNDHTARLDATGTE